MLIRKNIISLFLTTVLCLPFFSFAEEKDWVEGPGNITTLKHMNDLSGTGDWSYRQHPNKLHFIEIKTDGSLGHPRNYEIETGAPSE